MQLLQLRYFLAAASTEHFSEAAKALHVSQSALSNTITKLEKELGVQLFDRHGRQVRLNRYGDDFMRHISSAFNAIEAGKLSLSSLSGLEEGAVSVGIPSLYLIAELTRSFLSKYPKATMNQNLLNPIEMNRQLSDGILDFCLSYSPYNEPGTKWTPLMKEEIFLLVPAKHKAANRSCVELYEMKDELFSVTSLGTGFDDACIHRCKGAGFIPRIGFSAPEGSKQMVSLGQLVSFISQTELDNFPFFSKYVGISSRGNMPDPELPHVLRISNPVCYRELGVTECVDRFKSKAAEMFLQEVKDHFKNFSETLPDD